MNQAKNAFLRCETQVAFQIIVEWGVVSSVAGNILIERLKFWN